MGAGHVLSALAPLLAWSAASAEPAAESPAPPAAADATEVNDTPTAAPAQTGAAPSTGEPTAPSAEPAPASESYPSDAPAGEAAVAAAPATSPATPSSAATSTQLTAVWHEPGTSLPWFGAGLDVGVPDGATASLVIRPIRAIRAHAGLSHNGISLGERFGVTWSPLRSWVAPTLSVEYGHYADGNANPLVRAVMGDTTFSSAVLDRVGYDYANARVGIEFGRRWFTFYLHAGVSRVTGQVHNLTAEAMSQSSGTTSVSFSKDPSVELWSVSARLGFVVYLAK